MNKKSFTIFVAIFFVLTSFSYSFPIYAKTTVIIQQPAVKKSSVGICHAKGTKYYLQTKSYKAYKTLKDCLKSGGRLPKK